MQFIDLGRQYQEIEEKVNSGIRNVLNHKRFIMGSEVVSLEKRLAEYLGVKYAKCCASGTDALTISLMAIGLEKTDAVFVPSFTFFASAESITLAGGTPVFVDCREDTFNMSVESLNVAISQVKKKGELNPKGIIAVDLFGQPAEHSEIAELADKEGLFVLEDGAQGFGGSIRGKKACSFGMVAATSFFPAKPLGCYGDGGAIFTNDDELIKLIDSIHVHGQGSDKYDNVRIGLNSRLDTMQAVVLDAKMDIFDNELVKRNRVADMYTERLKGIVDTPAVISGYESSWAQYTVKAHDLNERSRIMESLKQESIPANIYYSIPVHNSTAYESMLDDQIELHVTESLSQRVFSLPMHPYLSEEEIDKICSVIRTNV